MTQKHPAHAKVKAPVAFYLLPQQSGLGYQSYAATEKQYGTQKTLETVVQTAGDYFRNQGVELQIGDMSFKDGATMSPHVTHTDGKCVDIRPVRKDKKMSPTNIHDNAQYDRAATELLVKALLANSNVKKILFNDKSIVGVHWFKGHDDHLHVTFNH